MPGHERRTRPPQPGESKIQNPLAAARERAKADLAKEKAVAAKLAAKPAEPAAKAPAAPKLDGEGKPFITLAQLLKKLNVAETGGAAKHLVRGGGLTVNGTAEARPGRKLHQGDKVVADGKTFVVDLKAI